MNNEVPDFSSWLEIESARMKAALKDGTIIIELRKYRKKIDGKKWQTGSMTYFFGKEVIKIWNIFISDEEILLHALKTDEGNWEIGLPILKESSDEFEKNKVLISSHVEGMDNPFIVVSMFTANGRIERRIYKNDIPPKS